VVVFGVNGEREKVEERMGQEEEVKKEESESN
jgi:hypothetical protein